MQRAPRTLFTAAVALTAGLVFSHACARGSATGAGETGSDAGDAGHPDAGDAGDAGDSGPAAIADAGCASDDSCGQSRWCEQPSGACLHLRSEDRRLARLPVGTGLPPGAHPRAASAAGSQLRQGPLRPALHLRHRLRRSLVCRSEGIDHPVQRCGLAPPQCLGDVECPDSPARYSHGYCGLAARSCRTDCRTGADCHAGYLCDGQSHACVAETCLQAGGAASGCDYGQFCCGQPASPSPCPAAVDAGACYDKPAATWCGACSSDDDCNKAPFPARSGNPNKCIDTGKGKVCALGCDMGQVAECPRSWGCENVYVGCSKDSDCGSQGGAHCDVPADGGGGLCTCGGTSNCPNDASNVTTCRSGKCVFTSVCRPSCP